MSTKKYLDLTGLQSFCTSILNKFALKNHSHPIKDVTGLTEAFDEKVDKSSIQISPVTTSGTGAAYIATVNGITALESGARFVMLPHTVSTTSSPTLDVNGLGAKPIRQRLSNSTQSTVAGTTNDWLAAGKPVDIMYDGAFWVVDFVRPNMVSAYGVLPIENGGTGATTVEQAKKNLGITDAPITIPDGSITTEKIANDAITIDKLAKAVTDKLNTPQYVLPVATSSALGGVKSGGDVTVNTDGTMRVNSTGYQLPVANTSRLGGVKAGGDININSNGIMTVGSDMIIESQLAPSVRTKLNSSGGPSVSSISMSTTSSGSSSCWAYSFGNLAIIGIQTNSISGHSAVTIATLPSRYTPYREVTGACVAGNGIGQFVIRTSGSVVVNPKGNSGVCFFTCAFPW